ncbi:MAG TPA: energy transducer TonB, partial [Candidatus Saccharimonadales bacterium]|nr:energy transducer TonB [Candidatus Saccharimonadales bacterium]
ARPTPPTKSGSDAKNVLVVNALPVPDRPPSAIPAGELSGTFTVSPVPLTSRPGATKLAGGGLQITGTPAVGNGTGSGGGSDTGSNAGSGTNASAGAGKGTRAGVGAGTGTGHGGTGHNPSGNGSGGVGLQISVNRGSGSGSGNSPFSGVTIQGGSGGNHSPTRAPAVINSKTPASYGITIIANGASGGGFKDFGVFQDEASYTVYLDMADTGLSISSWTLQYALYSHRLPGSSHMVQVPHGLLTPPYAITKALPRFSSEAAKRAAGTTIVVSGIVNLQGKFEDLRIMQSPDPGLNQLLLDSLAKWTLQPAKMDGAHVPVKFLLGVPVNSIPRA